MKIKWEIIKILFLTISLFTLNLEAYSQTKPILLAEVSQFWEDKSEILNHKVADQARLLFEKDRNGAFVIRFCSTDLIANVLNVADGGHSFAIKLIKMHLEDIEKLTAEKFPQPNIFYLRNEKGCKFDSKSYFEYWFIPAIADFPEFVEIQIQDNSATRSLIHNFEVDGNLISKQTADSSVELNPEYYETFKKNLVKLLTKDRFALVLINFSVSAKEKNSMFREANQLKQYLIKENIRVGRILVKKCEYCQFDSVKDGKSYPNVTLFYK